MVLALLLFLMPAIKLGKRLVAARRAGSAGK
jgi:hypothetical protein